MINVIPNQAVCKQCMTKVEYESSDVMQTTTKYPNIEFEPNDRFGSLLIDGNWVVNGYVEVVHKYIECPNCKTKIKL